MPYMGSKSRIAEAVISRLPPAKHFYDVFGGGGAMSHCAALSGKYQIIHYNEPAPLVRRAFRMAATGQFRGEDRWISREDFARLKSSDPYVALCWSFGNNLSTYLYGRELESLKRVLHHAIFWDDWGLFAERWPQLLTEAQEAVRGVTDRKQRRLAVMRLVKIVAGRAAELGSLQSLERLRSLQSLESLERLQSLESLERLERLERLEITSASYADLKFERDAVIYCDPPYEGTTCDQYGCPDFDFRRFWHWARRQKRIYVSDTAPKEGMTVIWDKSLWSKVSGTNNAPRRELLMIPEPRGGIQWEIQF